MVTAGMDGYGRFMTVGAAGTTFTHELGHLMAYGMADMIGCEMQVVPIVHANNDMNRQYKPNRWSVMSYGPIYDEPGVGPAEFRTKLIAMVVKDLVQLSSGCRVRRTR